MDEDQKFEQTNNLVLGSSNFALNFCREKWNLWLPIFQG